MKIIHEFENFTVSESVGGDFYIETEHGEFFYLSPSGSDEHKKVIEWIKDPDRVEEDFLDDEFLRGVFADAMQDKDIPHEFWNCSQCGDWTRAVEFAGKWYIQDDDQGQKWYKVDSRPDWSKVECPNCE